MAAIPAYNAGDSIRSVVERTRRYVDDVLVVDDASDDETARRASDAGAMVREHAHHRGYGGALQTAFREAHRAGVDHLVVLDGTGHHDPAAIPKLLDIQRKTEAGLVIGSRFAGDSPTTLPLFRSIVLRLVNFTINLGAGDSCRVSDTTSEFRVFGKETVRTLARRDSTSGVNPSAAVLYEVRAHGYSIEEVETTVV